MSYCIGWVNFQNGSYTPFESISELKNILTTNNDIDYVEINYQHDTDIDDINKLIKVLNINTYCI